MPETRLVLDREDFGQLVRGRAVRRDAVAILLADIGFEAMATELHDAIRGAEPFKLPAERETSAVELLRRWYGAYEASLADRSNWEAVDELGAAGQAVLDWCRQEFGQSE